MFNFLSRPPASKHSKIVQLCNIWLFISFFYGCISSCRCNFTTWPMRRKNTRLKKKYTYLKRSPKKSLIVHNPPKGIRTEARLENPASSSNVQTSGGRGIILQFFLSLSADRRVGVCITFLKRWCCSNVCQRSPTWLWLGLGFWPTLEKVILQLNMHDIFSLLGSDFGFVSVHDERKYPSCYFSLQRKSSGNSGIRLWVHI